MAGGRGGAAARPGRACAAREGLRPVPDRLRTVRPAAHRHLRRGVPHLAGAPGVRPPVRSADPAVRVLRRHGRPARSTRQHSPSRAGRAASAEAADLDPGPVRHRRKLWPQHESAAEVVPRRLRLRIRVRQRHRMLPRRPLQRGAAPRARAPRGDPRGGAADARRRAAGDLQPDPADLPGQRARAPGGDPQGRSGGRHRDLPRTRPAGWSSSRSSLARASCSGAPTGRCAGPRSASTTRCPART